MTTATTPRGIGEIRDVIRSMPFAHAMDLMIDAADDGSGVVSMPLSDAVTYDGSAFAGVAAATVADVASGAAGFRLIPRDRTIVTRSIQTTITASTRGTRLRGESVLRGRTGDTMIFDAVVSVERNDEWQVCASGVIELRVV